MLDTTSIEGSVPVELPSNVVKMEKITEKNECKKALDQIADYDDAVTEFCIEIWQNICGLSLSLRHTSQPLTCEKNRFVLQWEPEDYTN